MKGRRFYHDQFNGNVIAIDTSLPARDPGNMGILVREGIAAMYPSPNSPVCSTSISLEYLAGCKRVSEARAREIHPALFERLDAE